MHKHIAEEWCSRLESGKYRQGRGRLRLEGETGDEFCCFGVLCEMAVERLIIPPAANVNGRWQYNESLYSPPEKVKKWANTSLNMEVTYGGRRLTLSKLNDDFGLSFKEIARVIRRNVKKL